jgi:hypothetical protein
MIEELPEDWRIHAALGLAEAARGNRDAAMSEVRWLQESPTYQNDAFDGPLLAEARAKILAQLGDTGAALEGIEQLLSGPSWISVHTLRLDPRWDPVRDEQGFQALLREFQGDARDPDNPPAIKPE